MDDGAPKTASVGLSTDAYAFLNINDSVCAWAAYRGTMVCAPEAPGFLSVWSAGMLRAENPARISSELTLERVRATRHRDRVSRLRGMFCFMDLQSAEQALSWGSHFCPEFLAELHLGEAGPRRDRLDSNWITYAPRDSNGYLTSSDWIDRYWAGEPCPGRSPIWETIVDGRLIVLGTGLRERAYRIIKNRFPESLTFLEIARLAAWVGSDVGSVTAYLMEEGDDLVLGYVMDMREADDPAFVEKIQRLRDEGHPINWADVAPRLAQGTFGRTMDLTRFGFRRPKVAMPCVGPATTIVFETVRSAE
jgi:hypothetical protein